MEVNNLQSVDLDGKSVLLRLDLNVPMRDGRITDDTRIQAALPTVKFIREKARHLVICSHLGRPKGEVKPELSLAPVGERLAELLGTEVVFVEDYLSEGAMENILSQLTGSKVVMLENLRFHGEETKNDSVFARQLVTGFDVYVNDAFGTLHRAHASVVGAAELLPNSQRAAGLLVEKELRELSRLRQHPEAPFCVVMGGAKVSDKIGITLSILERCNSLMIGGAMAYTFLKFLGRDVGASRVEEDKLHLVESLYRLAEERRVEILLPVDHVAAETFAADAKPHIIAGQDIPEGLMGLDIGPETVAKYGETILAAKTVFWNGPMGVFEWEAFAAGSLGIAKAVAETSAWTVVGGGDSVAAVNAAQIADRVDHISTGGGAALEYLEGKVLPGVRVLFQN